MEYAVAIEVGSDWHISVATDTIYFEASLL